MNIRNGPLHPCSLFLSIFFDVQLVSMISLGSQHCISFRSCPRTNFKTIAWLAINLSVSAVDLLADEFLLLFVLCNRCSHRCFAILSSFPLRGIWWAVLTLFAANPKSPEANATNTRIAYGVLWAFSYYWALVRQSMDAFIEWSGLRAQNVGGLL